MTEITPDYVMVGPDYPHRDANLAAFAEDYCAISIGSRGLPTKF